MPYVKSIEVTQAGMVVARVREEGTGRCVGLEFFHVWFSTNAEVVRACKKAHKWADIRIGLCERHELSDGWVTGERGWKRESRSE